MTPADIEKVEEIAEDASWRVIGFIALILGHYWYCLICLSIPIAGRSLKRWIINWRIKKAEDQLKELNAR